MSGLMVLSRPYILDINTIMNHNESAQKTPSDMDTAESSRPWYRRFSIEEGGIERVTDEERLQNTTKFWNCATFW